MALTREDLIAELTEEQLAKQSDIKSFNVMLYEISERRKTLAANSISLDEWTKYRDVLRQMSEKAADEFRDAVWVYGGKFNAAGLGYIEREQIIDLAYELVSKYGEGAADAACEWYDAIAALSGAKVPAAVPAATASYETVAKTINGILKVSENENMLSDSVGRLVKQAGQDTTLQNAERDKAEVAWIPMGDTCAYCLYLASEGWVNASQEMTENKNAKHIHANCDCAYAVRFKEDFNIAGYKKGKYLKMYQNAEGDTRKEKINSLRRTFYEKNADEIKEQKREAYKKRKEREASQEGE